MRRTGSWTALPLGIICIGLIVASGVLLGQRGSANRHAPEERALNLFQNYRADFLEAAKSIENDGTIRFIDRKGVVNPQGADLRVVPQYRDFMQRTAVGYIQTRQDGAIDFAIYSGGGILFPDSQIGIRFRPAKQANNAPSNFPDIVVSALTDLNLPKNKSGSLTGFYVVPIEPGWFVFKNKYR
jgi:hypothetical protein